jgi:purine-nucleoside phosphorylase
MPKYTPDTIDVQRSKLECALEAVRPLIGARAPRMGIILGSGLGVFADSLTDRVEISYRDIPGFPVPAVVGHAGKLIVGKSGGHEVLVMQGRGHLYEGYTPQDIALPVRMMHRLGVQMLMLTNAAGSTNPDLHPGTLMLIDDHINFSGYNPLTGPNDEAFGVRFPDNSAVYDSEFRRRAKEIAAAQGWELPSGVYMFMTGPSFETPSEVKLARILGADVVGMSTFPEALAGFHCGMRVGGVSFISNAGAGLLPGKLDHSSVLAMTDTCRSQMIGLMRELIQSFA